MRAGTVVMGTRVQCFRAAAVVRAIAVHNINVKNKLACVLL